MAFLFPSPHLPVVFGGDARSVRISMSSRFLRSARTTFRFLLPAVEVAGTTALTTVAGVAILERVDVPNISLAFVIPVLAAEIGRAHV